MKLFIVSFVASLSLATSLFGQGIETIVTIPGRATNAVGANTVNVTNYVSVPVQQQPVSWQPQNPPSQQPYVAPAPQQVYVQPQYIRPTYPGVVVTPAGRPVEQQGDWVPIGGFSYGNPRRSYGYGSGGSTTFGYSRTTYSHVSGAANVYYTGQSANYSGTISVPGGRMNGGYSRPVQMVPAKRLQYVR